MFEIKIYMKREDEDRCRAGYATVSMRFMIAEMK